MESRQGPEARTPARGPTNQQRETQKVESAGRVRVPDCKRGRWAVASETVSTPCAPAHVTERPGEGFAHGAGGDSTGAQARQMHFPRFWLQGRAVRHPRKRRRHASRWSRWIDGGVVTGRIVKMAIEHTMRGAAKASRPDGPDRGGTIGACPEGDTNDGADY